jgi:hypothetical protein
MMSNIVPIYPVFRCIQCGQIEIDIRQKKGVERPTQARRRVECEFTVFRTFSFGANIAETVFKRLTQCIFEPPACAVHTDGCAEAFSD